MIRLKYASIGLLLGCGASSAGNAPRPSTSSAVFPPPFVRVVDGFEVRDQDGTPYDHPFLGGLNVPRPQLVDIDNDGDLDLFVQEATGQLAFFEQAGTPSEPDFVWRTQAYQDLDIGEWYRFVDMDNDGDYDLLAERRFSYIQYFRNDGSPEDASFTLVADTLKDVNGTPIFSDRQNIPQVTDIDCDGRLDLFIGLLIGTVKRYEEVGRNAENLPLFRLVTDRFQGIEIVAAFGSLHGANTMAFEDIDQDGDQDFFWGDFFEAGLLFIENIGNCATPVLTGEPVAFPVENPLQSSGYNAPAFGDVDGDGDVDLFVGVLGGAFNPNRTTIDNLLFYENEEDGFTARTRRFITNVDMGSESIPAFADLDGDGDLDLLLSNKIDPEQLHTSLIFRFENQGTATRPDFQRAGKMNLEGLYHYAPAFADLDADGDLDMLLGSWKANIAWHRNDGTAKEPRFELVDSAYVTITRGSNTTPTLVDIDADGDQDLFIGESSGAINFYRNVGTPSSPNFEFVSDRFSDIDIGRRSVPTFADLDQDGDQDLLVGSESDGLTFFRNTGTPQAAVFVEDTTFNVDVPPLSVPVFVDIDGDGDLDLFVGGIGGGVVFYENRQRN
ncbi:MAG: VCBS repeat-containing protein [Gemmatimonadetes bacterium]|nr:VCBS repeat-containing protein [Gemmatimonadota bacterium]